MDYRFNTWIAKSITTLYSLTDKSTLKNLQALQAKFLQISSATLLLWPNYKKHMHNDDSVIKEMLRVTSLRTGALYQVYTKNPNLIHRKQSKKFCNLKRGIV